MKLIAVRDELPSDQLVLIRFGVNTLSDVSLDRSCQVSFAKMGLYAFSVFGVSDGDHQTLAQLANSSRTSCSARLPCLVRIR